VEASYCLQHSKDKHLCDASKEDTAAGFGVTVRIDRTGLTVDTVGSVWYRHNVAYRRWPIWKVIITLQLSFFASGSPNVGDPSWGNTPKVWLGWRWHRSFFWQKMRHVGLVLLTYFLKTLLFVCLIEQMNRLKVWSRWLWRWSRITSIGRH